MCLYVCASGCVVIKCLQRAKIEPAAFPAGASSVLGGIWKSLLQQESMLEAGKRVPEAISTCQTTSLRGFLGTIETLFMVQKGHLWQSNTLVVAKVVPGSICAFQTTPFGRLLGTILVLFFWVAGAFRMMVAPQIFLGA